MRQCGHCGTAVTYDEPIPRDAECTGCGKDLRACVQCRHYDPAYNNACRETMADPVVDKDRRNFCEYFSLAPVARRVAAPEGRQAEARSRLESLFGGGGNSAGAKPRPSDDARRKLEDLFRKPDPNE
jgi:hypothetical protein